MPSAFAITTLHVCRRAGETKDGKTTPAEVEVVPAGQIAELSDEHFKAFEIAGAVRRPTKMDRALAEGDDAPEAVEVVIGRQVPAKPAR